MVSPSKHLPQQQPKQSKYRPKSRNLTAGEQLIRESKRIATTTTTTNKPAATAASGTTAASKTNAAGSFRIQRGPKPLEGKLFYLDIKNHALSSKLETKIKDLGGTIELFLVKNVTLVVTDRGDKSTRSHNNNQAATVGGAAGAGGSVSSQAASHGGPVACRSASRWADTSGGSGGPPSLMSLGAPTPTPTPPTPYRSVEGPLSNSTNQRGSANQRSKSRVDAMLERALTQPQQYSVDPLNNAQKWSIPIWTINEFYSWFGKVERSAKSLPHDSKQPSAGKQVKIKHLNDPYVKFESYRRETRPVFLELKCWPTLNFDDDPGSCPFDLRRKEKKEVNCANKEIKENREKCLNPDTSKGKDMTRRPRATATRVRKTENTGYCEICRIDYKNLSKHLQTDQHLNFVRNDKNFLSLDNLINTGASVEAFLKINRSKDVGKDCSLFAIRDNSLENGLLLSNEKSEKKDQSSISEFSVDEMRMMQCNGARKNLSSRLDSAHNLRTRMKHESGHLLRSKGKPYEENEKSDKPSEKFIITKRAKGTIWIEEDDSENEKAEEELVNFDGKPLFNKKTCEVETRKSASNGENAENVSINGVVANAADEDDDCETADCKYLSGRHNKVTSPRKVNAFKNSFLDASAKTKVNGYDKRDSKPMEVDDGAECNDDTNVDRVDSVVSNRVNNVNNDEKLSAFDNEDTNSVKSLNKDDRCKFRSGSRRGGRTYRGRQRLSVEERLIEDNRDYYKVEVLGNKLRSSAIPGCNATTALSPSKEQTERTNRKEDDKPSSEKPVVVRFKRVRKSELSLLSDEAESFMFGDPRRDDEDSSELSDGEQSSILPKDTESDGDEAVNSMVILSSSPGNVTPKKEIVDDDSRDGDESPSSRARKRRRTQTEALLKDNTDYYKFEVPGSRLRYQAPLTGICDPETADGDQDTHSGLVTHKEKVYPSRPSAEVEKMHYSFEAVPRSEPWYQTYERQDRGDEFYYFSESDSRKPFLLPYEIENFHEILQKSLAQSGFHRKRGRGRGGVNVGTRSPRKSPRCHASTLAIMSTIIRRREQQTTTSTASANTTLSTIPEEGNGGAATAAGGGRKSAAASNETAGKSDGKKTSENKSDVDEDLKQLVKNIENMLSDEVDGSLDEFVVDPPKNLEEAALPDTLPKGAPTNLLEILEHAQNGFENSSCASSECGELMADSTTRRRKKKRKNKTGWPGNKMRRKLHIKNLNEELQKELQKEMQLKQELESQEGKNGGEEEEVEQDREANEADNNSSSRPLSGEVATNEDEETLRDVESEHETGKENEQVLNLPDSTGKEHVSRSRRNRNKDRAQQHHQQRDASSEADEADEKTVLKRQGASVSSEDSEASLSNNENVCSKDANALTCHELHKRSPVKFKRKRKNTTSSEASSQHVEIENRKQSDGSAPATPKKQLKRDNSSDNNNQDLATSVGASGGKRNLSVKTKKRKRSGSNNNNASNSSKNTVFFEDENCKNERRRLKKRPRRNDSISSELLNGELVSVDRVSPSSDVDQRRSSIDFQPVVRVMKIDHSVVDMDNRRLRSSAASPKTNAARSPKKRFRNGAGRRPISGLGMKNS